MAQQQEQIKDANQFDDVQQQRFLSPSRTVIFVGLGLFLGVIIALASGVDFKQVLIIVGAGAVVYAIGFYLNNRFVEIDVGLMIATVIDFNRKYHHEELHPGYDNWECSPVGNNNFFVYYRPGFIGFQVQKTPLSYSIIGIKKANTDEYSDYINRNMVQRGIALGNVDILRSPFGRGGRGGAF